MEVWVLLHAVSDVIILSSQCELTYGPHVG